MTVKLKDLKVLPPDHKIYKEPFKTYFVNSLEDYKKQREKKEGLKNLFLEKIGDKNTSDEEMLQNLINVLEKNGIKIKGKPEKKEKNNK